jgi:hypothetical protein
MISTEWLYKWKCFISNKISSSSVVKNGGSIAKELTESVRKSGNDKIGILPPGPINNDELFMKTANGEHKLRPDLEINKDYRGVNKEVW